MYAQIHAYAQLQRILPVDSATRALVFFVHFPAYVMMAGTHFSCQLLRKAGWIPCFCTMSCISCTTCEKMRAVIFVYFSMPIPWIPCPAVYPVVQELSQACHPLHRGWLSLHFDMKINLLSCTSTNSLQKLQPQLYNPIVFYYYSTVIR